jgi:L,D-transpeptidase ErfK/SrfK
MLNKTARFFPMAAIALVALAMPLTSALAAYDKDYVGKMEIYRADYEDTLVHLARSRALGFVEMRAANPNLDPWIPGAGARVVLPTQHILPEAPREGIVINLSEMRLYYFGASGKAPVTYPISPGREGLYTPIGTTTVIYKRENPTWTPTPRMLKEDPELKPFYPAGPDNPMGRHALYLGWDQYRIHGTNKPYAIGRAASSGCIRMYPESIKELFPMIANGTKVTVVDQPVKVGWIENKMYVEVSPTQEQSKRVEQDGEFKSYEITSDDMRRITKKAGEYADLIDWEAVRKSVREHRGYPVAVLDRKGERGKHVMDETEEELKSAAIKDKAGSAKKAAPAAVKKEVAERKPAPKKEELLADAREEVPNNRIIRANTRTLNQ